MRKPKEKPATARAPKRKLALGERTILDLESKSGAKKVKGGGAGKQAAITTWDCG